MNFLDYVKGLFKKTDRSRLDALKEEITGMTNNPPDKPTLPDGAAYDRIEYDPPTDAELAAAAEAELNAFKNEGLKAIEGELNAEREKLEGEKDAASGKLSAEKAALDAAYDRADKQVSDDVLKRGLARSSIAVNRMADLAGERAAANQAAAKAAAEKLAALDEELAGLSFKREQALNDFNISLAAKLTEKINKLKDERHEKQVEATKYNNALTEKEQAYAADKVVKESALYDDALDRLEKENKLNDARSSSDAASAAIYEKMRSALQNMSASDARAAVLEDTFFSTYLPSYYYYKLYDEFGRR